MRALRAFKSEGTQTLNGSLWPALLVLSRTAACQFSCFFISAWATYFYML